MTVNSNTDNIKNGTYKVYAYSDKNYNNLLVSATKSEWENGVEITYNNLQQNATIYFRGQTGTDRWGNATFDYNAPKDSRTITQILSGTNINIG